jgi:glycine cleavage system H protein
MKYFTNSHEWIEVEGSTGTVGITDYAKEQLGDAVYVELPKLHQTLRAGEVVCVIESTKAASDIYTPVSGVTTAINEALPKNPAQLNTPDSWLYKLHLSNPQELSRLLSEADYKKLVHT